jgi:glycosyltransferase involved in cell wall biosynthesis
MFPPHHHGGYELIWRGSVEHLAARGHDVAVLASDFAVGDPAGPPEPPVPIRRELRWYWSAGGFPRLPARARLALERHNARVLERALADHRPDVVGWWAMGGMSLSLVERVLRAGLPSCAAACDDWFAYGSDVDQWTAAFAKRPWLARPAELLTGVPTRPDPSAAIHAWVFLSGELERRARRAGVEPRWSRVAHRGVDRDEFAAAAPEPWRWRLAYVGRLDERKGVDMAVGALAELPPEATLSIDGRGDAAYEAELRALAERLGVAGRVAFGVADGRVRERIAAADAVLFPVRWSEPWGLVPLEAMAVGRPVIASGRGGSGEYLRDGENCLIADPDGGPQALAATVSRLASDEALRERLRAGGRATVERLDPATFDEAVEEGLARAAATRGH